MSAARSVRARPPSARPIVLLAAANDHAPSGAYLRGLAAEIRGMRELLEAGHRAGEWELDVRTNLTPREILTVLAAPDYADRLAIFHFAGHAGPESLWLQAESGAPVQAHAGGLAAILGSLPHLRLAFLNGCATEGQVAALLSAGVPAVVATDVKVDDAVAGDFAVDVYRALVNGQRLQEAVAFAEGAARVRLGTNPRSAYRDIVPGDTEGTVRAWPWAIHPAGDARVARWTLADLLGDPRIGLPSPRSGPLPAAPYRHLHPFTRRESALFFGRGRELRVLYDSVTDPDAAPVQLLYSMSGAGKSSLLDAGLLPRLEGRFLVRYARRDADLGLGGTLRRLLSTHARDDASEIGAGGDVSTAWSVLERSGQPVVVILDQVEEAFTRPIGDPRAEIAALVTDIVASVADADPTAYAARPPRRVVLSFRKEWLAELQAVLRSREVWFETHFLDRLDKAGVVEAIRGPADDPRLARRYQLDIALDVAEMIAGDLLADADAPVAPTLQVLLAKMWEVAPVADDGRRVFDIALYDRLRREGILLGDYVDQVLAKLASGRGEIARSGLALDLLVAFVTSLDTARTRTVHDLRGMYRHVWNDVYVLLGELQAQHLLTTGDVRSSGASSAGLRLAHDTIAPLVRRRWEESDLPGQRAWRILRAREGDWRDGRIGTPLDEADLAAITRGRDGMRLPTRDGRRLLRSSRLEVRRRQAREVMLRAQVAHADEARRLMLTLSPDEEPEGGVELARSLAAAGPPYLVLQATESTVNSAVFRPDGRRVATASNDGIVRIGAADGRGGLRELQGHEGPVHVVAFSPDGRFVVSGSEDGSAILWPAHGGEEPVWRHRHRKAVHVALFSPDGRRVLTGSHDGTVVISSIDGAGDAMELVGHTSFVHGAAFSPDGRRVVTASGDGTARIWDADRGGEMVVLSGHNAPVYVTAFSPDGACVLTASRDGTARVWRADGTGAPIVLAGHTTVVACAGFSPDGTRVVTGSEGGSIRLWASNGEGEVMLLAGHEGAVHSVHFSPDGGYLLSGSRDGTARRWSVARGEAVTVFRGHAEPVYSAVFSPGGSRVLTASGDGTVRVWRADGATEPTLLQGHAGSLQGIAFAPDGTRVVTASEDGTARVWRSDGLGKPVVLAVRGVMHSAVLSPDGTQVLTAASDGIFRVWSADSAVEERVFGNEHRPGAQWATYSPDGRFIATVDLRASDASVQSSDGTGPVLRLSWQRHWRRSLRSVFSPDGRRVVTVADVTLDSDDEEYQVELRSVDGTAPPIVIGTNEHELNSVAFSRDGTLLATASGDVGKVWRLDGTGEPVVLRGHRRSVNRIAFSPDGEHVVTASADGTARIWRADGTGEPLELTAGSAALYKAVFSPDGRRVLTASDDGTALLWPANGRGEPVMFGGADFPLNDVTFSDDGALLATASTRGVAKVHRLGWRVLLDFLALRDVRD